jgi:hypothetical protein
MIGDSRMMLFGRAGTIVAIAFFEYKLEDNILGHQCQTVDPEDIHIGARLVVQPIE